MNRIRLARRAIVVTSMKGGVGKSTVTSTLATWLAKKGVRTGILDIDLVGPSIPHLVGATERPPVCEGWLQPVVANGVRLISPGLLSCFADALAWHGPILRGAVRQLVGSVDWGELDVLLVDMPAGAGEVHTTLFETLEVDGGVIVMTEARIARDVALRARALLRAAGIPLEATAVNRSRSLCLEGCGEGAGRGRARGPGRQGHLVPGTHRPVWRSRGRR